MQVSIILCQSQASRTWEGCGRKGSWRKNGGMMEVCVLDHFVFCCLVFVLDQCSKRLAAKEVSEMIYFVSSGT